MMGINPTGMFAPKVNANINALSNSRAGYSELDKEIPQNLAPINNQPQYNAAAAEEQRQSDLEKRLLDATRESDNMTNWWNTGGSSNPTNWGRVQSARDKLAAIEKEVRATPNFSAMWGKAVNESRARHKGYNNAWDANQAQKASEETAKLQALRQQSLPQERFNQMSPIEQHAYRNYNNEAEYTANHDRFLKEHFAGSHAGFGNRGNTLPWRAPEAQRTAFWNSK